MLSKICSIGSNVSAKRDADFSFRLAPSERYMDFTILLSCSILKSSEIFRPTFPCLLKNRFHFKLCPSSSDNNHSIWHKYIRTAWEYLVLSFALKRRSANLYTSCSLSPSPSLIESVNSNRMRPNDSFNLW